MASENETLADIIAAMRCDAKLCSDAWLKDPKENPQADCIGIFLNSYARRIEAAWKRETSQFPQPDPDWKAICEKCHDGDIEPDCEYYCEPNGCNSPIYGEHPKAEPVGNAAAMREALMRIKHLFRDINLCVDILGNEAYAIADAALSAPPRNCDIYPTNEDAWRSYQLSHAKNADAYVEATVPDFIDWLFAPAEKGADA